MDPRRVPHDLLLLRVILGVFVGSIGTIGIYFQIRHTYSLAAAGVKKVGSKGGRNKTG